MIGNSLRALTILQGNCAIEIREEDALWLLLQRFREGHICLGRGRKVE